MSTTQSITPSLQDFSTVKTNVESIKNDHGLADNSIAFNYFALDLILNLQPDEIDDAITDTHYLASFGRESGHDRGIDALYIESETSPPTIHFFNFKYTDQFKKVGNHFPATEIDKIIGFLNSLMQRDEGLEKDVNKILFSKVEEIWAIFESQVPHFVMHICTNYYNSFEKDEKVRFEREMGRFANFKIDYALMSDFIKILTHRDRIIVNGRLKAIDKQFFEKSDGDIRALIVNLDSRELLRIVCDDEELRNKVDIEDYAELRNCKILEDAFEDNVRIYLKQRSKINRNIKETAMSNESHRFFYYNNGITIKCDSFEYPKTMRSPIISLNNIQIVNGSQTAHALYEAFFEKPDNFEEIEILTRIYETKNNFLGTSIAEYTNSQNPVSTRDIRSNDFVQKKLEQELLALGYFYERKKNQYQGKPKSKRLDAEKVGQTIMAFYNKMPSEAKDKKRLIFAEKYDEVFNDDITAYHVIIASALFDKIEGLRKEIKGLILEKPEEYDGLSYILHTSYYLLYLLSELAEINSIKVDVDYIDAIWEQYTQATNLIKSAIAMEKKKLGPKAENYNHRVFFKGNRPKVHLEDMLFTLKKEAQDGDTIGTHVIGDKTL